jgi:nitric oxide reductase subunit B
MKAIRKRLLELAVATCVAAMPVTAAAIYPVSAYPDVRTEFGYRLFSGDEIRDGERAWATLSSREPAAVQGRGIGAARQWRAEWLKHEQAGLRDMIAEGLHAKPFTALSPVERATVERKVREEMARDSYNPNTNTVIVSVERGEAIAEAGRHYLFLLGDAPGYAKARQRRSLSPNALATANERKALAAYLFWTSWSASPASRAHAAGCKPD